MLDADFSSAVHSKNCAILIVHQNKTDAIAAGMTQLQNVYCFIARLYKEDNTGIHVLRHIK